jgi:hypothetical protein
MADAVRRGLLMGESADPEAADRLGQSAFDLFGSQARTVFMSDLL